MYAIVIIFVDSEKNIMKIPIEKTMKKQYNKNEFLYLL